MKRVVSESQFTEAVYRHYHGESLTSIAKSFGVGQSALSQLKSRRASEWECIRHQIVATEVVRLVFGTPEFPHVPSPDKSE